MILMLQMRSNASFITSTLKNQQSTLLDLETPEISLRSLADVFEESIQEKGDVLEWLSNNQCDFIVNLAEQKWSWKSIFTAISVIAIGVAQIALGAVLLVGSAGSGSFLCNALISEGVSDMIFGIEGLARGHCNWSQYFDHKIMSVAITVATAGIGALFARGAVASRYAYKAFGNASKELVKATAKETGKSVGKIMAKQVGKKIGKKVVEAAVDAGINLACDKIVEEMSQSIDGLSQCILSSFDSMSRDEMFKGTVEAFLKKEDPDKAEKHLNQVFMRVMQRKSFQEVWDEIESKLQTAATIATGAHGRASKQLQMVNKKMKGKGFMKGIGYVSRFAPLITEPVKIGLVKKKMDLLKEELTKELKVHPQATKNDKEPLDSNTCEKIFEGQLKEMKEYLSQQISQRGKTILTTGLRIVGQELKKHTIIMGKNIVTHKIKGFMDLRQLRKYESKLSTARSEENRSMVAKYEGKLNRLMSHTRNPKVFALLIERHNAELGPAFAIPVLEKKIGRPITLVNEDGQPLLNVQNKEITGRPLEVRFIPGNGVQQGHFYVGKELFSFDQHGNDCLIHAVMKGAGKHDYIASSVRKDIASACQQKGHPCNSYITSGIARNYVMIGLTGGRPSWWSTALYPFIQEYGRKVQGLSGLENCNRFNKEGKMGLREMKLDICHILSWNDIKTNIDDALKSKNVDNLNKLLTLLPSYKDVKEGRSLFGNSQGQTVFLKVYTGNTLKEYADGVSTAREIVESFSKTGKMVESDRQRLEYYLHSAPANMRLGDASLNRRIKKHMDHNPQEERSNKIHDKFKGCKGFTKPQKDADGKIVSSYYRVKKPPNVSKRVKKTISK